MPDVVIKNIAFLANGLSLTLLMAMSAMVGGFCLGLCLAVAMYMRVPVIGILARLLIEFVRGTPLLVVLFIFYFALPSLIGYRTTPLFASILGFTTFIGAYLGEDIAAGLKAVPRGAIESARALGLKELQILWLVTLPIGLARSVPPIFNQFVRLLKFTSVASVIGVHELTGSAMLVNAREFQPVTIIVMLALSYLLLCLALSAVGRVIHSRLAIAV
jgi:His/Glu/Gln/Arg/opine family amino acid ABC transporter permease subunit